MKVGDVLLRSQLFSHVINPSKANQTCDFCLRSRVLDDSLLRCSNCQIVYYCGRECQRGGWKIHKEECKFLVGAKPHIPPQTGRFFIRTLIKLKKGGNEVTETLPNGVERSFDMLMTHEDEIKEDDVRMDAFDCYFTMVELCFGPGRITEDYAFKVFCRLMINSVSICDGYCDSIGTGLYLALSAVDHSCVPNAEVQFTGRSVTLRAMEIVPEPIMENLRISYNTTEFLTRAERQDCFRQQYYFECDCSLCQKELRANLKPSLPCSKCENQMVVVDPEKSTSEKCKKCKQKVETFRLDRYTKWRLSYSRVMQKCANLPPPPYDPDFVMERFSLFCEGSALGIKNDMKLVSSADLVINDATQLTHQPPVFHDIVQAAEVLEMVSLVYNYYKERYHRNSMILSVEYQRLAAIMFLFKVKQCDLDPKNLMADACRIVQIYRDDRSPMEEDMQQMFNNFGLVHKK